MQARGPEMEPYGIHCCEGKQGCIECEVASREAGNEDKGFAAMHRSGRE